MRKMKDSGVEWIGEIPENWNVYRLKHLLTGSLQYGASESGIEYDDLLPRYIRITDITEDGCLKSEGKLSLTEEMAEGYILTDGDVLFARSGASVGKTFIYLEEYGRSAFAGYLIRARINVKKCLPRFVYYNTTGVHYELWKNSIFNQATIQNIGADKYANLQMAVPNLVIQEKIVTYLDEKCSKIDAIIARQEEIIEKLKEYKLSIITEAVTKGLHPEKEMKDSGVERIGVIPSSWKVAKVTRILDFSSPYPIGDGDHGLIKTENYKENGIPYIRVQNLGWGTELLLDNVIYISAEDNERIKNSELHPNDILFCKTGATIGKTGIVPEYMPVSNTTSHVGKITVDKKYNPRFVFYFLSSFVGYMQFWDIACMKSTRPELSIEETKGIQVVIPDTREEQDYIVKYLDKKTRDISMNILKKQTVVEKLKEYKKSLIYEVVTGKKEV